jgi:hypothetical protein
MRRRRRGYGSDEPKIWDAEGGGARLSDVLGSPVNLDKTRRLIVVGTQDLVVGFRGVG